MAEQVRNLIAKWSAAWPSPLIISRQRDNGQFRINLVDYPEPENYEDQSEEVLETISYYLTVWMKQTEDGEIEKLAPIQLPGPYWRVYSPYTQLVQCIKFQFFATSSVTGYIGHSTIFTGLVLDSLEEDGEDIGVIPAEMWDAYKQYIEDKIIAAGVTTIDPTLSIQGAAADAKAAGDAVAELNGRLEELESGSRGGLSSTQKQTLMDIINALGGAFTTPDAQDLIDVFNSAWNVAVTGISLNKSTLTFSALTSETLRATLSPSDATGTVTWASSNTSVATVDSNGTVVVVGNGTATITASCGGYSATCAVTVSGIRTTYTVTYNLTGCESSNPQTRAEEDSAFTANITPVVGYLLPFTAYTVTMGGTDITASAWSNGTVSIAEVTGAIVISATATVDSRTLLYAWDLTQSLVDTVNNTEATLINTVTAGNLPTRDSNGLHFTEAGQVAQFVTLDNITSKVIEMDVASMDFKGDTSKHIRLLDNNYNNNAQSLLIRRNSGIWTAYQNGWQTPTAVSGQTTLSDVNAFSGHTVSCEIASDRSMTVYVDGTPIYTIPGVYNPGKSIAIGGGPTGSQNDGQQIFDCTITGLRIYSI